MSQHDLNIANADGATVRADLNGALAALGTTMKGPSAPSAAQAGWCWLDDNASPWILRVYDGVDWITIGDIDPTTNVFTVAGIGSIVQGYDADTAKTDVAQTFSAPQRSSPSANANISGSVTLDFSVANDYERTLTGNVTLENPSNLVVGQKGTVILHQDATGGRTMTFGTYWLFPGGAAPTLTTDASAVDRLDYHVVAATQIHCAASLNWK